MSAAVEARQGTVVALEPFVPRLLLDWQRHDPATRWRRVEGTMVSADISGFTKLSERLAGLGTEGAEELTDLINDCFDGMIAVAEGNGGDVLKFGGDALLLFFTGPCHAERACAAAVAMRASLARPLRTRSVARVALKMSVGVHSGEFDLFVVDAGHTELLVVGPGVTATVDCEAAASAGQILLSKPTAELVPAEWLAADGVTLRRVIDTPTYVDLTARPRAVEGLVSPAQLAQVAAGIAGEHRRVTVAFLKFSHLDDLLAAAGPEDVGRRLDALAAGVREAAERHGVHWLASDVYGDGGKVILTTGAPVSLGHDEDRMLRAVREIIDADPGLRLRAGVNAGKVFAGVVGAATRRVYTVMGDAVNLAARLMQRAEAGEVIATRDTLDHAASAFRTAPIEPFLVKGKAAPIHADRVGLPVADIGAAHAATPEEDLALVGRDAELAVLASAATEARRGATVVVDVVAEVGAGKSRLLDAFAAEHPFPASLRAHGGLYSRATPYLAVRRSLRSLVGVDPEAHRVAAGAQLAEAVRRSAPELAPWLPLLAVPMDAEVESTPEVDALEPAFRRARLHAAVLALIDVVTTEAMLVLVDDAQWLDEASGELLDELARRRRAAGLLVVVAREPRSQPLVTDDGGAACIALDLSPLDVAAARRLLVAAARTDLLPDVVDRLVEHAGGSPLFLIELARSAANGDASMPDSIEALVTARIDTLPPAARVLLREASVLGTEIDLVLAAEAFDLDGDVTARWEALDGFVAPGGPGRLRFRHGTYRRVAYEGLPFRRRRQLHRRIGTALESRPLADELAPLLALHFHRAQSGAETWRYNRLAGDQARGSYANVEAADFYRQALDAVAWGIDVDVDAVRDTWVALGDVSEVSARYDAAARAYAAAHRLARDDAAAAVAIARKRGVVCERAARYTQALRWYSAGLRRAEELDAAGRAAAVCDLANAYAGVRYRQGRWKETVRWAKRAAADAEVAGDRRALAHAWYLLDIALSSSGSPEANHYRGRALPVFEELGDLIGQANALNNQGVTAYYESRWQEAIDCYARSHRARELAGDVVGSATEANNLGEVLSDQGHLDEARQRFGEALAIWRAAQYPIGVAVATSNLGRLEARAGQTDEALALLRDARDRFTALGATALAAETDVRIVECLVLAGRDADALAVADAVGPRVDRGEGDDLLRALLDRQRAVVLHRLGRYDDADALLRASLDRAHALGAAYEEAVTRLAMAQLADEANPDAARLHRALARSAFAALGVVPTSWLLETGFRAG